MVSARRSRTPSGGSGQANMTPDTLLDLHAKLSTVVRYYDRMLEERLSKAYSQQHLGGYNLPPPRQASGPYPSIQSNLPGMPNNPNAAESFYGGQTQPSYPNASNQPYQQLPPQATPQNFAAYGQAPPEPQAGQYPPLQGQQPNRSDSWQQRAPPMPQDQHSYSQPQPHQQPPQALHQQLPQDPGQMVQSPPQQPLASPSSEPNASYYFQQPGQHAPSVPSATGPVADAGASPYPNLQQSMQYHRGSISTQSQATPVQAHALPTQAAQPTQPQPTPPVQSSALPLQQQQQYWQQSMPPQQQQQAPPAAQQSWSYAGYGQEAFPAAPQHEPMKQPAQEEALIEF